MSEPARNLANEPGSDDPETLTSTPPGRAELKPDSSSAHAALPGRDDDDDDDEIDDEGEDEDEDEDDGEGEDDEAKASSSAFSPSAIFGKLGPMAQSAGGLAVKGGQLALKYPRASLASGLSVAVMSAAMVLQPGKTPPVTQIPNAQAQTAKPEPAPHADPKDAEVAGKQPEATPGDPLPADQNDRPADALVDQRTGPATPPGDALLAGGSPKPDPAGDAPQLPPSDPVKLTAGEEPTLPPLGAPEKAAKDPSAPTAIELASAELKSGLPPAEAAAPSSAMAPVPSTETGPAPSPLPTGPEPSPAEPPKPADHQPGLGAAAIAGASAGATAGLTAAALPEGAKTTEPQAAGAGKVASSPEAGLRDAGNSAAEASTRVAGAAASGVTRSGAAAVGVAAGLGAGLGAAVSSIKKDADGKPGDAPKHDPPPIENPALNAAAPLSPQSPAGGLREAPAPGEAPLISPAADLGPVSTAPIFKDPAPSPVAAPSQVPPAAFPTLGVPTEPAPTHGIEPGAMAGAAVASGVATGAALVGDRSDPGSSRGKIQEPGEPGVKPGAATNAEMPAPRPVHELEKEGWVPLRRSGGDIVRDVQRDVPGLDDEPAADGTQGGTSDPNAHADKELSFDVETPRGKSAGGRLDPDTLDDRQALAARSVGKVETVPHTVERGENFWTISRLYYSSGRYYKALWKANSDRVKEMDQLVVGTVLRIPPPEELNPAYILPPGAQGPRAPGRKTARQDVDEESSGSETAATPGRMSRANIPADGVPLRRSSRSDVELNLPISDPLTEQASGRGNRTRAGSRDVQFADQEREPEVRSRSAVARPVHKVQPYETLRTIARDRLGDGRRADEIYDLNRDVIEDPSHLIVGQILELPEDARGARPKSRR